MVGSIQVELKMDITIMSVLVQCIPLLWKAKYFFASSGLLKAKKQSKKRLFLLLHEGIDVE